MEKTHKKISKKSKKKIDSKKHSTKANEDDETENLKSLSERYNSLSKEEKNDFDDFVDDLFTNSTTLEIKKKKQKKNQNKNFFLSLYYENRIKYAFWVLLALIIFAIILSIFFTFKK